MPQSNYTLQDKRYFNLVGEFCSELDQKGIEYAVVGGCAIQSRVSELLSHAKNIGIENMDELDLVLRKTKDVDITSHGDEIAFVTMFNEWQAKNPNVRITQSYGKRRVVKFKSAPASIDIFLNYQTGSADLRGLDEQAYNECIETAQPLELWHGNKSIEMRVAKPEYLIASKLTRAEEKDIYDISMLLRAYNKHSKQRIDFTHIRDVLKRAGKEQKYEVLEGIISEVLKE